MVTHDRQRQRVDAAQERHGYRPDCRHGSILSSLAAPLADQRILCLATTLADQCVPGLPTTLVAYHTAANGCPWDSPRARVGDREEC